MSSNGMRIFERKDWSHILSSTIKYWHHFNGMAAEIVTENINKTVFYKAFIYNPFKYDKELDSHHILEQSTPYETMDDAKSYADKVLSQYFDP